MGPAARLASTLGKDRTSFKEVLHTRSLVAHTGFALEPPTTDFSIEPLKTGFPPEPDFVREIATTENQCHPVSWQILDNFSS